MEEENGVFCKQYQTFSATQIEWIQKNLVDRIHLRQYTHKKFFFEDHTSASEKDYYDWWYHIICNDWQNDIWFMSDKKFEYHWPMVTAHIYQYNKEEDNSDD